ncbi:hypothetical protein [Deinococcus alpinitundrae]|uniref:hypothetical protein n=1 Tax=Deinococcus alpinitundrae TaxID=468913 RepID=UPI00137ACD50|nr:hypothetical protein [Deinococcus alpinitundrae]
MTDDMQAVTKKGDGFYLGETKLQDGMGLYVLLDDNEVVYGEFKIDQGGEATFTVISDANTPATVQLEGKKARLGES